MKLSDIPEPLRSEVEESIFSYEKGQEEYRPEEMFELLLRTEGIIGFASRIKELHDMCWPPEAGK